MNEPEKVCEYWPVSTDIAAHVLAFYGAGGYHGGGFTTALLRAITHADESNRGRLALAFPGYVRAVNMAERDPAGIHVLKLIALGRPGAYYATPEAAGG